MAGEIASAIQSASINRHPDPNRDIAPSTSADKREPVRISSSSLADLDDEDIADDEIPVSVLDPEPRRSGLPPLPDMRFEQSYLKSIERAESWQAVAFITIRDQVCYSKIMEHSLGLREADRSCRSSCHSYKELCGTSFSPAGGIGIKHRNSAEEQSEREYDDGGGM